MWNNPKPAPEYPFGWKDEEAARESFQRILEWNFNKIIIAHGDLLEEDATEALVAAWKRPLAGK